MSDNSLDRREFLKTLAGGFSLTMLDWNSLPIGRHAARDADTFDAIVTGSGLGGLSCAAAFARQGFKPLVLERHDRPGGYATTFTRPGGFVFDVSLHSTTVGERDGLHNLIPGFPLDGGRVLRAGLWAWGNDFYRATKQAAGVGLAFGSMLGLVGLVVMYGTVRGELPASMASNGGWILVIGTFLFATALASRRQAVIRQSLATVPIRDLMVTTVISIPWQCTLDEAVNRYFQSYGYGGFPVLEDGRLVGLITVFEIQNVPSSLWPWRRVEQVMRSRSESLVIEPDIPVIHAMERMARERWDRLVVMQDGEIVGLVTHSAIVHFLQLRGSSAR